MHPASRTDEELLSSRDAASFEAFYLRHADALLGYFARRTGDPEMAADLTSQTFAAALAGRHRYKPEAGAAAAWLFGIAARKLADAQRRGYAERRMCRRLGMERIELSEEDVAMIQSLAESSAATLLAGLAPPQRDAVKAHIIDERPYGDIALELRTSEAVVRKRVSRGLATARRRIRRRA